MQDLLHPPEWVLRCSLLWLEFTKLKEGCSKQGPENHLPEKPSQITDTDRCTHLFGLPPSFLFSSTGSKYQRKPPRKRIFASPSMFCTWGVAAPPPTALLFFLSANSIRHKPTCAHIFLAWAPPTPPTPSFCNSSPKRHSVSFFQMGICLRSPPFANETQNGYAFHQNLPHATACLHLRPWKVPKHWFYVLLLSGPRQPTFDVFF